MDRAEPPVLVAQMGGRLPPGTYHVIRSTFDIETHDISPPSEAARISLPEGGSIGVQAPEYMDVYWMTEPDGGIFYRMDFIPPFYGPPTPEPCQFFGCEAPPDAMQHIVFAFGRAWGAVGREVFYSEPFRPEFFNRAENMFRFDDPVNMIAVTDGGMFFGTSRQTFFLSGGVPREMSQWVAGPGVCPGTLTYVDEMGDLENILGTVEKMRHAVPVWLDINGRLSVGYADGRIYNLTGHHVRMPRGIVGASFNRIHNGALQIVCNYEQDTGTPADLVDADTQSAMAAGTVLTI